MGKKVRGISGQKEDLGTLLRRGIFGQEVIHSFHLVVEGLLLVNTVQVEEIISSLM